MPELKTEEVARCAACGHVYTLDGCTGDPTPSDLWAGVSPEGCDCDEHAWVDRHGDVWTMRFDGLMETAETRPFPAEHVEKKWGPLQPATASFPSGERS